MPLTDNEFDLLDDFLLERIDEEADTEGKDEGVLDISELDGFFTAVVSGPVMVPPSKWLPAVWGDFEPGWKSKEELEEIFSMMMRHMNGIAATLMEYPGDFEPAFMERVVENKTYLIVDEWCEGYCLGVALAADSWKGGGDEMTELLSPIQAFTTEAKWWGHDLGEDETVKTQNRIARNVRKIHAYWLTRRKE